MTSVGTCTICGAKRDDFHNVHVNDRGYFQPVHAFVDHTKRRRKKDV